ncbi:single-stranded DNA-binding protein [Phototrophicus methaneseepsis]|uniref:Single-stranded DNA-binding protein n=1 Tax=Phototrophicus methaneseepsis TaxID=2710758 RepID=A0A7S8IDX2_9CHLR|nr:single-stranded DNA-binding protein [Phototrophicus methaneseepsis]QPC83070.1 single-stranded DNA-binding protein [Phototrophicus methaneseepsis]
MGTHIGITLTGHVGSEPQVRTVQTSTGEKQVATFSIAVNRTNGGGQQQTLWVRVNCWQNLASVATSYVKRGVLIQATGSWLRPSAWVDQNGNPQASLDMDVDRLILLERVENGEPEVAPDEIPF